MPVVWIDPFIGGSTTSTDWGNGTTSNTTRNGSYASPFKFDDWRSNTNSTANTVNGQTVAANTEIRIKGKTLNDMFFDVGDVYFSGGSSPKLYAVDTSAGSTTDTFLTNSASLASRDCIISGTNVDIINNTPTGFAPFLTGFLYSGTADWAAIGSYGARADNTSWENFAQVYNNATSGLATSQRTLGYLKAMKQSVRTAINQDLVNGDGNYWFYQANLIKISAGWTSETEQNGYSYIYFNQSDAFEYQRFRGNNVHYDCARLGFIITQRYMRFYIYLMENNVHHKFGQFHFNGGYNISSMTHQGGSTVEFGTYQGRCSINVNANNNNTLIMHNVFDGQPQLRGSGASNSKVQIGNFYSTSGEIDDNQKGFVYKNAVSYQTVEFLANSSFLNAVKQSGASANAYIAAPPADIRPLTAKYTGISDPTYIYGSGLKAAGNASGTWLNDVTLDLAPNCGNVIQANESGIYTLNSDYNNADWWTTTGLDLSFINTNTMFAHVVPCGKLQLNGSDFRTTNTTIKSLNDYGYTSVATNYQPMIFGFETNDYDQRPIAFMTPNSEAGLCGLAYNETVSGTEYLVLKTGGGTGSYIYPVEVPVPSHTAGSNNIRLKIRAYHHTGAASASVQMLAFYRKDDSSNDYAFVQDDTMNLVSYGSDSSSPRVSYLNIPLSASGVREINSIMVYLRFYCSTTSHNNRVYVEYVVAETY